MQQKYDVVIIGSGIGGLSAGSLLAHAGYKTLVAEKLSAIGGRWSNYWYKGFWLPAGALAICYHGMEMENIYREVGAPTEWVRVPQVFYRIGGKDWEMPAKGAIVYMFDIVDKIEREVGRRNGTMTFNKERLINGFRLGVQERDKLPDISLKDWALQYTDNEMALGIFDCIANTIGGAHAWEIKAKALFTFMVESKGFRDVSISPKGNIANAATLADVIKAKGGDVWLNCPTTRIIVEQGKAKGVVVTKNGKDMTIATQAVISNAGPRATVELAGEKNFPEEYLGEVRVKVKAHPVTICYVASDRPIWPENGSPAYQMIVGARRITSVVPLSTISPFYAPKGQYLTFCFAGPLTNDVHMDTKVEKQQIMLDLREQFPLFEKHGKVLKFIFKDIDDDLPEMRSRVGEGVSTETPIKNLYGVGDANGPYGLSGSNLATSSARIVAETVKKSYQPGTT